METRDRAVGYTRGRIDLHHCADCDFVFNAAFDPTLLEYSERYEETQGFSPTFRAFHRQLAQQLIDRWDLRGKRVLEIGCGKGEFLALLCELSGSTGVGFDPAFVPERAPTADGDVHFYAEAYPPKSGRAAAEPPPDLVCCKMTLEHIADVRSFVVGIRESLPDDSAAIVFFQVPNAERIFRDNAFWDVYYEHASYFTQRSLSRLFETCGFDVVETWTGYCGQYLMLSAVSTASASVREVGEPGRTEAGLAPVLRAFSDRVADEVAAWRERLTAEATKGGTVCLWGGGSKAVSFLSLIGSGPVDFAVDINPHKAGCFLPGSGLEVVGPDALPGRSPTLVIAMNSVYEDEIADAMRERGVSAELVALA